jgi:hypothetical protein
MGGEDHMFLPAARRIALRHRNAILRVIERAATSATSRSRQAFNRISIDFMRGVTKDARHPAAHAADRSGHRRTARRD